jgi:HAE1 family hydrophobic/amphiphilic exporter-1
MTSTSTLGNTTIALQFTLERNIDGAAQDVQAAVNAAGGQLPANLPSPPNIRKVNPADGSVFVLAMTSQSLPISTVSDYADNVVAQQLSRIEGVGLVTVGGVRKPAVRIQIDPRRAAARGLQIDSIRAVIAANTVNAPKGQLNGALENRTIYANDQELDASHWNDLIVGYAKGAAVHIGDVGKAFLGVENNQSGGYVGTGAGNGADPSLGSGPSVILLVQKSPGANVIKSVEAIKSALPAIEANIPPSIQVHVIEDKTQTIRASVDDVEVTLLITIVLVVAVIFLFLRNVRATLIPSSIIPVALLGTAAFMLPAGFSLDNLSLMALTIAVGFVVDDAIVMVEAIWRRIEHGEKPFQAAMSGAGEIGFTILTIAISLIAVFAPIMFMGGAVGRFMREFALTLSAAVVLSVLLSLTFTPMLCARFLKAPQPTHYGFMLGLERGFLALERSYARGLQKVMRHKRITLGVFLATLVLAGWLYATASTGFFPQQDTGFLQGTIILPQNVSLDTALAKGEEVVRILSADPDVTEGRYNANGNLSQINVNAALSGREQGRKASADQIIARLRPKLAEVVGVQVILRASQDIVIGARGGRAQYQYILADGDLDELNAWAPRVLEALQKLPQLKDVSSDQQSAAPSTMVTIDRLAAGRFGISPTDIDSAIYSQVGQRQVAQYFTQLNNYHVILEGPPSQQASAELFNSIYLTSPRTGKQVPLSALVRIDNSQLRSASISHQGQFPAAALSFNLAPGAALGEATAAVEKAREDIGAPPSVTGQFSGSAQAFQESLSTMPILIVAALLSVYIILGVLYESYIHPLTILSTLPSAGVGALLFLKLGGYDLNVIGIIAIILLIGIVKKNGIMIVDVALKLEREQGISAEDAVIEASHQRLRPILMTTACAFLGGVPMILGHGTGSEFRQPLGWAICGGLLVSQVLTLFSTPVLYVYLDRARQTWGARPAVPNDRRGLSPPKAARELLFEQD